VSRSSSPPRSESSRIHIPIVHDYAFAPGTYAEHVHTVILVGLRLTCPHRPVPLSCSISGWPHRSHSCKSSLSPSRSFRSRAPPGLILYPHQTYRNPLRPYASLTLHRDIDVTGLDAADLAASVDEQFVIPCSTHVSSPILARAHGWEPTHKPPTPWTGDQLQPQFEHYKTRAAPVSSGTSIRFHRLQVRRA
jgi:hypothetical protein